MEMLPFRSCIHIYHGDGKGKTTAAMGLALRALGAGIRPCVVQFLKTEASSERRALEVFSSKGLHLVPLPASMKFTFQMDKREKQEASSLCLSLLEEGLRLYTWEKGGLLILDEVLDAVSTGLLPEEELEEALRTLRGWCRRDTQYRGHRSSNPRSSAQTHTSPPYIRCRPPKPSRRG